MEARYLLYIDVYYTSRTSVTTWFCSGIAGRYRRPSRLRAHHCTIIDCQSSSWVKRARALPSRLQSVQLSADLAALFTAIVIATITDAIYRVRAARGHVKYADTRCAHHRGKERGRERGLYISSRTFAPLLTCCIMRSVLYTQPRRFVDSCKCFAILRKRRVESVNSLFRALSLYTHT